jgi:hypothetical protein
MTKMKTTLDDNQAPVDHSPTINCIALGHSCEGDLESFIGDLELRLYPIAGGWRVSTRVEPTDAKFDDFATRETAIAFLGNAVAEVMASL